MFLESHSYLDLAILSVVTLGLLIAVLRSFKFNANINMIRSYSFFTWKSSEEAISEGRERTLVPSAVMRMQWPIGSIVGKSWRTSPQVLQLILFHFTDKETEAQRDRLTFQYHLGSGSQDLNLGVGDSKFKKYIPMPHCPSLTFPPILSTN